MQKKSEKEEDEVWKMKRMRRKKDRFSLRSNPESVHSRGERERKKKRERKKEKKKEKERERKKEKENWRKRGKKRRRKYNIIVAFNVIASLPPECRPNGMPAACAKNTKKMNDCSLRPFRIIYQWPPDFFLSKSTV